MATTKLSTDFKVVSSNNSNAVFRNAKPSTPVSKKNKKKGFKDKAQILTTLHYFSEEEIARLKQIEKSLIQKNKVRSSKTISFQAVSNAVLKFLEIPK